jgi:hypothetical protein
MKKMTTTTKNSNGEPNQLIPGACTIHAYVAQID